MNKDIRLISISEDNLVTLDSSNMNLGMTELEYAVQRAVIALFCTPGTMIDSPSWGGGATSIFLRPRIASKEKEATIIGDMVAQTQEALLGSEASIQGAYRIIGFSYVDHSRLERGLSINLRLEFSGFPAYEFRL